MILEKGGAVAIEGAGHSGGTSPYDTSLPWLRLDGAGVVLELSAAAREWVSPDHVLGKSVDGAFHDDDRPIVQRLFAAKWTGCEDRSFRLVDARVVRLNARITGVGCTLFLHDLTRAAALDRLREDQRRIAACADLASMVARELNDPMSIVQGRLELLLDLGENDHPPNVLRYLQIALEHTRRVGTTLRNLRSVAQPRFYEVERIFVRERVDEALDLVGSRLPPANVHVDVPLDMCVGAEGPLLATILANLMTYVVDTGGKNPTLDVKAAGGREGEATIQITPRRSEFTGEFLDIERLHTFGTSVAQRLIDAFGGRVDVLRLHSGTGFAVHLPLYVDRPARARTIDDRLLVVGREESFRALTALIGNDGFDIVRESDANLAFDRIAKDASITSLACELFLPTMSGITFIEEATRRYPQRFTQHVVLLGEPGFEVPEGGPPLLAPPFVRTAMLEALGRKVRRKK